MNYESQSQVPNLLAACNQHVKGKTEHSQGLPRFRRYKGTDSYCKDTGISAGWKAREHTHQQQWGSPGLDPEYSHGADKWAAIQCRTGCEQNNWMQNP